MLDQMNFSMIQSESRMAQEEKDLEILLRTFTESQENQQDQNSSRDNSVVPKKEIKRRSDYNNTKVKTRNLLTNVSYRRFKQSDFHNSSFIVDILSFLVQNFNRINLDIKLDLEKEHDMVKLLWDECIPHGFVTFLYKKKSYEEISQPNLTYQKANNIVKQYLVENPQRINQLKFKIEEKFSLIHYIYSSLFSKIYNRTNTFGIKRKNNFDFNFQLWKRKKIQKNATHAKNPANYENRVVEKNEQQPVNISLDENQTILSHANGIGITLKKQTAKRKVLEQKLEENTDKMKKLKKIMNCKYFLFFN